VSKDRLRGLIKLGGANEINVLTVKMVRDFGEGQTLRDGWGRVYVGNKKSTKNASSNKRLDAGNREESEGCGVRAGAN